MYVVIRAYADFLGAPPPLLHYGKDVRHPCSRTERGILITDCSSGYFPTVRAGGTYLAIGLCLGFTGITLIT